MRYAKLDLGAGKFGSVDALRPRNVRVYHWAYVDGVLYEIIGGMVVRPEIDIAGHIRQNPHGSVVVVSGGDRVVVFVLDNHDSAKRFVNALEEVTGEQAKWTTASV